MAEGDLVTAARFNNLQARIGTVMGIGGGQEGYGQQLNSSSAISGDIIRASDMAALYSDMIRARKHQTGTIPNTISSILSGDLVNDDDNAPYDTDSFKAFEEMMLDIENDSFLLNSSEATLESLTSSSTTNPWNTSIFYEFTVVFNGYTLPNGTPVSANDHRRAFFNSGGEVRISANVSGGTGLKSENWRSVLQNIGVVRFNYTQTQASAGTGSNTGNYDLVSPGTEYTQLFVKFADPGAYTENNYKVYAKSLSDSRIQFKVEFNDEDTGDPGFDESVNGTTSVAVQVLRASGNSVDVPAPSFINDTPLGSTTPTGETAICVSVIDETSSDAATIRSDWLSFRSNWSNRRFWLLQPQTGSQDNLEIPAEYTADALANGPISVNVDNGSIGNRSDWFDLMNLGSEPAGTIISLSIDTSGSTDLSKIQASYDLFLNKCATAGFQVVLNPMGSQERWAIPHNVTLP